MQPSKKQKLPSRPTLPPEAENEIMTALAENKHISSDEVAAILKKHHVSGDADTLQDSYRKRIGQRYIAGIRDADGRREVLAAGHDYVIVGCCNDAQKLHMVQHKLQSNLQSIVASEQKVTNRIRFLNKFTFWKGWWAA